MALRELPCYFYHYWFYTLQVADTALEQPLLYYCALQGWNICIAVHYRGQTINEKDHQWRALKIERDKYNRGESECPIQ